MDLNADRFYEAAARAGLLKTATWMPADRPPQLAAVGFRSPDDSILDGLGVSRDYAITYPDTVFVGLAQGDFLQVGPERFRIRDIRAIGDGSERMATLSKLPSNP
jgi:hypothetical protein